MLIHSLFCLNLKLNIFILLLRQCKFVFDIFNAFEFFFEIVNVNKIVIFVNFVNVKIIYYNKINNKKVNKLKF